MAGRISNVADIAREARIEHEDAEGHGSSFFALSARHRESAAHRQSAATACPVSGSFPRFRRPSPAREACHRAALRTDPLARDLPPSGERLKRKLTSSYM